MTGTPVVVLVALTGCGARTALSDSPVIELDATAPIDARVNETGTDSAGGCNPVPNPGCAGDCQVWAQSLIISGYAHAGCNTQSSTCQMGDQCHADATGHIRCDCGDGFNPCSGDEVCVSDTPNGPTTCRKACVLLCPLGCTTTPCLCQTTVGIDDCVARAEVCNLVQGPGLKPEDGCKNTCPP